MSNYGDSNYGDSTYGTDLYDPPPGTYGVSTYGAGNYGEGAAANGLGEYSDYLASNWPPADAATPIVAASAASEPSILVEVAFRGQPAGNFQLDVSALDTGVVLSDWDSWVTVDGCRSVDIRRRFNRETGTWDPSTAQLRFNNRDRRYDPLYSDGPYRGVLPNRPIRITLTFPTDTGTFTKRLWSGFVDKWASDWNFPEQGQTDVAATDVSKIFAAVEMAETEEAVGAGDRPGERAARMISEARLPEAWMDTDRGVTSLAGTTWGMTVWDHLRAISEAEFGYVFVDGAGVFHLMDRYRLLQDHRSNSTQLVFGDDPASGEIPYSTLDVDYADRDIANECVASRPGTRAGDNIVVRSTRKFGDVPGAPDSVELFQRQSKSIRTEHASDVLAEGVANYQVGLYDFPQPQVGAIEVTPRDGATWARLLQLELGDRITVRRRPPGAPGTLLQLDCHITGLLWKLRPGKPWMVSLETFSARPVTDLFKIDNPTFGRADVNRLAP